MILLQLLLGLAALVAGAELLVRGAARLALGLGVSPLVVGLTVVAFGTSAPEVAVSVGAALGGETDIAVGNVVGSNVLNVLFILGASALITPLVVHAQIVRQEVPVMIGATGLLIACAWDGRIGTGDALVFVLLLVAYTVLLVRQSRAESRETQDEYAAANPAGGGHWSAQIGLVVAGLVLLVVGAELFVTAATSVARAVGVSELVIGLTIVALGTSMPEVATSIMAAVRGERDIAVGNVVGSNTFNILGCLGVSGLAAADGLAVAPALLRFDLWVALATALACLPVFASGHRIARWEGGLFLGYYVAYTTYLALAARQHDALPAFSAITLGFVVPLTVVTLVVTAWPARRR